MENITDKSIIYFKMPIIMNYCSNITLSSVCPHEAARKEGRSKGVTVRGLHTAMVWRSYIGAINF